jgi:23S rRNA (guanine745-N1)-methyltransferase
VRAAVIPHLRCPVCRGPLHTDGPVLRCAARHTFDIARQGYVDLTNGHRTHPGDTAEMVAARERLLAAGHYDFIAAALVDAASAVPPAGGRGLALEVGAGTGFYLSALLAARGDLDGLALDISKPALRRAGRAHPRLAAARADAWRPLPVADRTARLVLDVFAPRSAPEIHRVLQPDGALLVVTPDADHLRELADALGLLSVDPAKDERLRAAVTPWFTDAGDTRHRRRLGVSRAAARSLATMGPSAHHLVPGELDARVAALAEPFAVTAAVRLTTWRPRPAGPAAAATRKAD